MLMQLAKAVANAAAALVLKAKNVAQKTEDSAQQNRVIAAATQCALSTSQLVACTRVSVFTQRVKLLYSVASVAIKMSLSVCLSIIYCSLPTQSDDSAQSARRVS